jgi:hypothetical protein
VYLKIEINSTPPVRLRGVFFSPQSYLLVQTRPDFSSSLGNCKCIGIVCTERAGLDWYRFLTSLNFRHSFINDSMCLYLCTTNPTNIDSAACRCVVAEHIRAHCSKRRKLKIPSNCASGRTRRRRQLWFFLRVSRVSYTSEWNKFLQMDGYRMRESHAAERKIELYQYWISLL